MRDRIGLLCVIGVLAAVVGMPSAAAGGGCYPDPELEMTTSSATLVGIGECAFIDTVVHIEPGQDVRWVNKDAVPHTVTGAAFSWGSERTLSRGDSVTYAFKNEGVYPYYCALHPSMVGAVVVGDATKAAALTNGMADVEEMSALAAAREHADGDQPPSGTPSGIAIGLAIVLTLGLVTLVARTIRSRATFRDGSTGAVAPDRSR